MFLSVEYNKPEGMSPSEVKIYQQRLDDAFNIIIKLRRTGNSFLTDYEKEVAEDFIKNTRAYMRCFDLAEYVKSFYLSK